MCHNRIDGFPGAYQLLIKDVPETTEREFVIFAESKFAGVTRAVAFIQ